jgi:hypothetical protein
MRVRPEPASLAAFAACYFAVGGYFALGAAGQGSVPLRCFIAVAWPLIFSRYSPAGTLCMLASFAAVAVYVRRLRDSRSALSGQLARLAQNETHLSQQLRLSEEEGRHAARERDEALRQLADRSALPIEASGLKLVKQSFARRFHPDRLPADDPQRPLRTQLFAEFWQEIERIERQAKERA